MQKNLVFFFFIFFVTLVMSIFMLMEESGIISLFLLIDDYYVFLLAMTALVNVMCMLYFSKTNKSIYIMFLNFTLFFIFMLIFLVNNIILFYIIFEMSVLPLMFFISSWGYSLERVKAMMYMFIYTVFFSLPFLFMMMFFSKNFSMNILYTNMFSFEISEFMLFFMLLMFLMKMPMWGFHLWLTKAHVEASTEGSMILAGIVLKLAGIGMIKFFFLASTNFNNKMLNMLASVCITGALILSYYSARQTDSKLIVAISSIVHMSFLFLCFFYSNTEAFLTMLIIMFAHGVISPLMFLFLGYLYEKFNSRTLHLMKGVLQYSIYISMIWFMVCTFNMGLPLTMNFFGEILFFLGSLNFNKFVFMVTCILVFSNGLVNMYMYNFLGSGKNNESMHMNMKSKSISIFYASLFLIMFIMCFLY